MVIDLKIDSNYIEEGFSRIARELMNKWILRVEEFDYRITEMEFYLKSESHNDIFTHGNEQQKKSGRWYFHGSGLDLTFGSDEYYGGILIRAICNVNTGEYIYGPLTVISEIFKNRESVYYSNFPFGLISDNFKTIKFEEPIKAPRVGLNQNNSLEMAGKFYRFLVMPRKKHADKTAIAEAMKQQQFSDEDIRKIWG